MSKISNILSEIGVSKVRLAKYLGVSRQMVYNYLELNDINKWPKEKKLLLFKLLDVNDGKAIEDIEKDTDRNNWMFAEEALEYGLIDHVISSAE